MILIYTKDIDDFVNLVIDSLDEDFIRIGDFDNLNINEIVLSQENDLFDVSYPFFKSSNIKKIKSIWFNGGYVRNKETSYENDCYEMLIETYLNYKNVYKIGRLVNKFEINKLDVLFEAKKQGFKIPDTILTEDKDNLILFHQKYNDKNGIICKRITDKYHYKYDDNFYNFNVTFLINSKILNEIPEKFAVSMFQERILADFEIRVVFIKGFIYAMSIHSFDDRIDYRSDIFTDKIRTVTFKLPVGIENKLKRVFKNFNLNYGSVDLMYCNNEYYFLEINTTGQISFVNNACNLYIENNLSKLLKNEH